MPPVQCLLLRGARGNLVRWLLVEPPSQPVFRDAFLQAGDRLRIGSVQLEVLAARTESAGDPVPSSPQQERPSNVESPEERPPNVVQAIESRMQRLEQQIHLLQFQSLQGESETLKETVERLTGQLETERQRHHCESETLSNEGQRLAAELDQQATRITELQARVAESESLAKHYQQDKEQVVAALRDEVEQLAQLREQDSRLYEAQQAQWQQGSAQLESEMAANLERLQELELQLEEARQRQTAEADQRAGFESRIDELSNAVNQLTEQLAQERQEFSRQQAEWFGNKEQLEARIADLEAQLSRSAQELEDSQQLAGQFQDHLDDQQRWHEERTELTRQLAEAEQVRVERAAEMAQLTERCSEAQTQVSQLEQQVEELRRGAQVAGQVPGPDAEARQATADPETLEGQKWSAENAFSSAELVARQQQTEQQSAQGPAPAAGPAALDEQLTRLQREYEAAQEIAPLRQDLPGPAAPVPSPSPAEDPMSALLGQQTGSGQSPGATSPRDDYPLEDESFPVAARSQDSGAAEPESVTQQPSADPAEQQLGAEPTDRPTQTATTIKFRESPVGPPVSTADVLARLGQGESWDEPRENRTEAENQPLEFPISSPPPMSPPAAEHPTATPTAPHQSPPAESTENDESIEDYMNRLLARVRGNDAPATPVVPQNSDRQPITEAAWQPEPPVEEVPATAGQAAKADFSEAFPAPSPPTEMNATPASSATAQSAGEFLPRTQAPERTGEMAAMRDLANQSTRSAIATHAQKSWTTAAKGKLLLIVAGLSGALVSMVLLSDYPLWGSLGMTLGLTVAIYFGWQATKLRKLILG